MEYQIISDELQARFQKTQKGHGFYHIEMDVRMESRWRCGEQCEEDTS
jgi:hypothetical protein